MPVRAPGRASDWEVEEFLAREAARARDHGPRRTCAECRVGVWEHPERPGRWVAWDGSTLCWEFSPDRGYDPPEHGPAWRDL